MTKRVVVSHADLGTNCWLPLRFLKRCFQCERYVRCKYPERVADETYDETMKNAANLKKLSDRLYEAARKRRGF